VKVLEIVGLGTTSYCWLDVGLAWACFSDISQVEPPLWTSEWTVWMLVFHYFDVCCIRPHCNEDLLMCSTVSIVLVLPSCLPLC